MEEANRAKAERDRAMKDLEALETQRRKDREAAEAVREIDHFCVLLEPCVVRAVRRSCLILTCGGGGGGRCFVDC